MTCACENQAVSVCLRFWEGRFSLFDSDIPCSWLTPSSQWTSISLVWFPSDLAFLWFLIQKIFITLGVALTEFWPRLFLNRPTNTEQIMGLCIFPYTGEISVNWWIGNWFHGGRGLAWPGFLPSVAFIWWNPIRFANCFPLTESQLLLHIRRLKSKRCEW